MKLVYCLLFSLVFIFSSVSMAKVQDMNAMLKSATAEEQSDLAKLLMQVTLVPTGKKQSGKTLFKVTKVEKGSMWERQGLKAGDLVLQ